VCAGRQRPRHATVTEPDARAAAGPHGPCARTKAHPGPRRAAKGSPRSSPVAGFPTGLGIKKDGPSGSLGPKSPPSVTQIWP